MGCLNANSGFDHWFGNIHLSGPCNRACYFCIGQHMMALDSMNNLFDWPLSGLDDFIAACRHRDVREVNLTGTNTDPLLYRHHAALTDYLRQHLPGVRLGMRTNGIGVEQRSGVWRMYDKASVSVTSFDRDLYRQTMGHGEPPDLRRIIAVKPDMPLKVNVVLCKETVETGDVLATLDALLMDGIRTVNLREPYGQPHIGDPLAVVGMTADETTLGMPTYLWPTPRSSMRVTYWDVHYCHVESVNLYANGRISEDYPITRGHDESGTVRDQSHFEHGRHREQWQYA